MPEKDWLALAKSWETPRLPDSARIIASIQLIVLVAACIFITLLSFVR